jgi:predicted component of type VI protein secretion system
MRHLILFSLLLAVSFANAQTEQKSIRLEKTEQDTVFVVESFTRVFPDGTRVIEETWRPYPDAVKLDEYLATQEIVLAAQAEALEVERKQADENIRKVKDLRNKGKDSKVAKKRKR